MQKVIFGILFILLIPMISLGFNLYDKDFDYAHNLRIHEEIVKQEITGGRKLWEVEIKEIQERYKRKQLLKWYNIGRKYEEGRGEPQSYK